MQSAQFTPQNFVKFLFSRNCIKIANSPEEMFLLKSGRKSPLFINLGDLNEGGAMDELANAYADAIHSLISSGKMQEFDFLYGPAYKGISLGALVAAALYRRLCAANPAPFAGLMTLGNDRAVIHLVVQKHDGYSGFFFVLKNCRADRGWAA